MLNYQPSATINRGVSAPAVALLPRRAASQRTPIDSHHRRRRPSGTTRGRCCPRRRRPCRAGRTDGEAAPAAGQLTELAAASPIIDDKNRLASHPLMGSGNSATDVGFGRRMH